MNNQNDLPSTDGFAPPEPGATTPDQTGATTLDQPGATTAAQEGGSTDGVLGRFGDELMVGGAVGTDDETVGGLQGAIGVAAVVGLFIWLGTANIWYLVFAIGMLVSIFLHELGHYVTARWTGMKATQFFIGFGPRLWSFRRGETEYGLRLIPAGAFVRIIGMNTADPVDPADEQRTYRVKSFPRRLLVISAGSIMHILIAIVLLFTVYSIAGQPTTAPGAFVGAVSSGAEAAGIRPADVIVAVGSTTIDDQSKLGDVVRAQPVGSTVDFTVLRGGPTAELGGKEVDVPVELTPSFQPSDQIVAVNRFDVASQDELPSVLGRFPDKTLVTVAIADGVDADGNPQNRYAPAVVRAVDGAPKSLVPVPLAGVSTGPNSYDVDRSIPSAAVHAVTDIGPNAWQMSKGVVGVINPVNVVRHLVGIDDDLETRPVTMVGVGQASAYVGASDGIVGVLYMLALLNVFIGVFNMVPLLPLDGGHAAVAVYERVRELIRGGTRRYYSDPRKLMPLTVVVVMLLGMMFLTGLYLDITQPL